MQRMHSSDLQKIDDIFTQATGLDRERREMFLDETCGKDGPLRERVEALLKADDDPMKTLSPMMARIWTSYENKKTLEVGQQIGNFKILNSLGIGGMGHVYLAQRISDDFKQKVAIKILHIGSGNREYLQQRFMQEQRLLAGLNHPYIAQLVNAGQMDSGEPYLAMEYVDGLPIDRYCSKHQLTLKQRIHLIEKVCDAVHYAHSRFVVHRDLKPANIFITADGLPKLLDFGIAKLLESSEILGEVTESPGHVYTPNYASPELLAGESVTTAADIYALGVILYQLLTGKVAQDISGLTLRKALAVVYLQAPSPPSKVLRETRRQRDNTGTGSQDEQLLNISRVPADLDQIVLKALHKEPLERYDSAAALRNDLIRFREKKAVVAASHSALYRLSNFVKRHRMALLFTAVVIIGLVASNLVVVKQQNRAVAAEYEAELRLQEARLVTGHILDAYREAGNRGVDLTASDILDQAFTLLENGQGLTDEVKVDLYLTIGAAYKDIGQFQNAKKSLVLSASLSQKLGTEGIQKLSTAFVELANLTLHYESREVGEGYYQKAVELLEQVPADSDAAAQIYHVQGNFFLLDGFYEQAAECYESALSVKALSEKEKNAVLVDFATLKIAQGKYVEADRLLSQVLEYKRLRYGEKSLLYTADLSARSIVLIRMGHLAEAERMLMKVLDNYELQLPANHVLTLFARDSLGSVYLNAGQLERAKKIYLESLQLREQDHGVQSAPTYMVVNLHNLAQAYRFSEEYDEAELYYLRAYKLTELHQELLALSIKVAFGYGASLKEAGKLVEAEVLLESALDRLSKANDQHIDLPLIDVELANIDIMNGRVGPAEERLTRVRQRFMSTQEPRHINNAYLLQAEARLSVALGDYSMALDKLSEAKSIFLDSLPYENSNVQRLERLYTSLQTSM